MHAWIYSSSNDLCKASKYLYSGTLYMKCQYPICFQNFMGNDILVCAINEWTKPFQITLRGNNLLKSARRKNIKRCPQLNSETVSTWAIGDTRGTQLHILMSYQIIVTLNV